MNTQTSPATATPFRIHPATRLGHVHLTVADLDRQVDFYQNVLGLQLHWREGVTAGLGAGQDDLLQLTELRGARRARGTTGLYHFAVLLPSRRELARAIARLFTLRYPNYPTDHVITETTYLDDPEGNGIELYADTPEDGTATLLDGDYVVRDVQGRRRSGRDPLDLEALMRELAPGDRPRSERQGKPDAPMPEGTTIGHVHLHVAHLDEAMRFYHGVLGFDDMGVMTNFGMGMVSAGRYHHHIGLNIWNGVGAPPPPPDARGLRYFTVVLPDRAELDRVVERVQAAGIATEAGAPHLRDGVLLRDPFQNAVALTVRSSL